MDVAKTLEYWETQIQLGKNHGLKGALMIGASLKAIDEGNLWIPTGCKTLAAYGEAVHGLKKSSIYNMIGIWETWGDYLLKHPELQGVDPTRLVRLLPLLDGQDPEEMLHTAAGVPSAKAFDDTLRALAGKVTTDSDHEHKWIPMQLEKCEICNLKRKVQNEEG